MTTGGRSSNCRSGTSRRARLLATVAPCWVAAGAALAAEPVPYYPVTTVPYFATIAAAAPSTEMPYLVAIAADASPSTGVPYVVAISTDPGPINATQEHPAPPAATAPTLTVAQPQQAAPRLNPTGRQLQIIVPLNDRGNYLGDVEVRVAPDDTVEVAAEQVFEVVGRTADPASLEPLRALAEPGLFLPLSRFAAINYPMAFDPINLTLSVEIPVEARVRQSIGLADLDRSVYGDFQAPAGFSAYLNMRGSVDYAHVGLDQGFGDTLILLDGAARWGGVVLENEASWSSSDEGFRREGTRFVYDDVRNLHRWVAGDLLPQGRGFQGVQNTAGISVERAYGLLDPQRNVTPRGGRSFTLDREATVEAYVNGRVVRTVRLQPGTYDVSDFPFVQGSNDVNLVILDDTGRREVLSFSLFIDRTQLAPGLSEYGFYAGVIADRQGGSIDYSDRLSASGFYRRGLTDSLTLGGNFQYVDGSSLVGFEGVWGSSFGTIGGDFAVSDLEGAGSGWAVNASYERIMQTPGGGTSLSATVEARSRFFGSPSQFAPDNRYELNAALAYNRSFGDSSFAGAQLRYAKARDGFEDERSIRASYGRRLTDNMNVVLDVDWTDGGFADGVGVRVALVRRFGTTGSMRAEYDTASERGRLGYQTSGGRGVGAWSAAGSLEGGGDNYGFNGAAAYAANRADLGLAHSTSYSLTSEEIADQRTSLRAATAIAFADGAFAVGRPVTDSFAIVRPYRSDDGVRVEVEPSPEGHYASSGVLGPALYGQIGSYSPRSIIYDAPEAPPGFDIGSGSTRVMSPYRGGYLVTVGSDYGVTAIGRLLNDAGEPVTFLSGQAIEQGGEGRRVDVFTNRSGTFGAAGLKAGSWRIEMLGGQVYQLTVPESPEGVARVGDLRPVR